MLYAGLPKKVRRERALEVLERVGLSGSSITAEPAVGRRTAARRHRPGAAGRPSVILADEPRLAGLKDGLRGHRSLQELHREGKPIVLITHDASIASAARRIIRLLTAEWFSTANVRVRRRLR
jgi:putative ABC transport system ATP-binding protein